MVCCGDFNSHRIRMTVMGLLAGITEDKEFKYWYTGGFYEGIRYQQLILHWFLSLWLEFAGIYILKTFYILTFLKETGISKRI